MASSTCRAWRTVLPYEDRLWSLPASPQEPFGNWRFHSISIRFPLVFAGEATLKVARPRPSARDLAKLCPRLLVPPVLWKSLWKLRWRRPPWKQLGRASPFVPAARYHLTTLEIPTQTQVDMESKWGESVIYTRCLEVWTLFRVVCLSQPTNHYKQGQQLSH